MARSEPVTVLFSRTALSGKEQAYEAWNKELIRMSEAQPGHLTTAVIEEGERRFITLQRFDSNEHLQAWLHSPLRQRRLAELPTLTEEATEPTSMTGMETWFRLPGHSAPMHIPRWKLTIVTIVVIYMLVLLLNIFVLPHVIQLPVTLRTAVYPLIMVPLMTYLIMPNVTKLLRRWLY